MIGDDSDGLEKLIREGGFYDLALDILDRDVLPPGTYESSGRCLDYILGTEGIKKAVIGGGMLPYNEGILSDHRAIFINFYKNTLLGRFDEILPMTQRKVQSNKPMTVLKYKEELWKCLNEHWVAECLDEFEKRKKDDSLTASMVQRLDDDITHCMKATESFGGAKIWILPWSSALQAKENWVKY